MPPAPEPGDQLLAERPSSGFRDSALPVAPTPAPGPSLGEVTLDSEVWRNRNFLLLWLAQAISQTAQNATERR